MSGWLTQMDRYCERVSPEFWAEPLNAVTNVAFLLAGVAGLVMRRSIPQSRRSTWTLVFPTLAILTGFGSFAFHTFANRLAALADVLPIMGFMGSYFGFLLFRVLSLAPLIATFLLVCFIAVGFWLDAISSPTLLNGSIGYAHGVLAMVVFSLMLRTRRSAMAPPFTLATLVFLMSLVFRTADESLCPSIPIGTHFLWHLCNAAVLTLLMRAAVVFAKENG